MGLNRNLSRVARLRRPPRLEALESRTLLSTTKTLDDIPAKGIPVPAESYTTPSGATDYDAITGASATRRDYKVDGAGFNVAIIDTGVNYRHDALGSGFGPGHKVVAGFDFAEKDGDPDASTWQHGTAVAGLVASADPTRPGVAPGAGIVALRVFGNDNRGDFNRVADALQWVVDNHDRHDITVVNLSMSDGLNYSWNWFAGDLGVGQRITNLVRKLAELDIPVVTASGNSFAGRQGMGFTSIIGESISVTATDASDRVVSNAQRLGKAVGGSAATDLAAPGKGLIAPAEGESYTTVEGTSFAAPLVSGSLVLLQQIYKSRFGKLPTVADLESWLENGSRTVRDDATGIDLARLDVFKAASLIPSAPERVKSDPIASVPPAAVPPPVNSAPSVEPTAVATAPAANPKMTEIYLNGKSIGKVRTDSLTSKLSNLFATLSTSATTIRVWSSKSVSASPTQNNPFAKLGLGAAMNKVQIWAKSSPGSSKPAGVLSRRRFF